MAVDPRRIADLAGASANERLRDRAIAHAIYLERLKGHETREIMQFIDDDLLPDLIAKLEARLRRIDSRGLDIGPVSTDRLRKMIAAMQEVVQSWTSGLAAALVEKIERIAVAEAEWTREAINFASGIAIDVVLPGPAMLTAAVLETPIDGVLLEDIVKRLDAATKNALAQAIRIGVVEGETIPQITRRVRTVMKTTRSTAEGVARTAVGHISNAARARTYAENTDILKGVQWVATLDTRTCLRCQSLDGKVYPLDRGARPPRHISCRCTTVPVLKSWREMGLDADDMPAGTRASMNGQVSGSITYNDWLKRMPAAVQDEALGKTRAALFRGGSLSISDFVDRQGQTYNLDTLRAKERAAFEKAGI
ncbi:MAG: phage minor head protein [Pseudomonadota bacterium]|nr:phage minor head protein [Pseudomonadota bacterium]